MTIDETLKMQFRNDYHRGIINLNYTASQLNYEFKQHLKSHNLTEPLYNILHVLKVFASGTSVSIGFLKERMLDKSSDVSRLVDKLVEQELVLRKENSDDRRQKDVEISSKGIELLRKMGDCEEKSDNLLNNLSIEQVRELNILLDLIRGD